MWQGELLCHLVAVAGRLFLSPQPSKCLSSGWVQPRSQLPVVTLKLPWAEATACLFALYKGTATACLSTTTAGLRLALADTL